MGHAAIHNRTPFAFLPLFVADEAGRPLVVTIVKATFRIAPGAGLVLAEEQLPVQPAGVWWGDPARASLRFEPETALSKLATDVVLLGHACALRVEVPHVDVGLRVGPLQKVVRVFGDRRWIKSLGTAMMTKSAPFERIPLVWERAFGGWDRTHADPEKHAFDPRNPVGRGFRRKRSAFEEGVLLPNLEDPRHLLSHYDETPAPVGFGFVAPHWQPRAAYAGTYDAAWERERMPLLPRDFDAKFWNAAPTDQVAPGYLRGNEPVLITGVSPEGRLAFDLPGIAAPKCRMARRRVQDVELTTNLDTVILDTDASLVHLIWRARSTLANGPHDVSVIEVRCETSTPALQTAA